MPNYNIITPALVAVILIVLAWRYHRPSMFRVRRFLGLEKRDPDKMEMLEVLNEVRSRFHKSIKRRVSNGVVGYANSMYGEENLTFHLQHHFSDDPLLIVEVNICDNSYRVLSEYPTDDFTRCQCMLEEIDELAPLEIIRKCRKCTRDTAAGKEEYNSVAKAYAEWLIRKFL